MPSNIGPLLAAVIISWGVRGGAEGRMRSRRTGTPWAAEAEVEGVECALDVLMDREDPK